MKEFIYKNRKCVIHINEWITAYVFLPELTEFYKKEIERTPNFFDRAEETLDGWFWENVPYITYFDMGVKGHENELACGLDLNHYWNIISKTTKNIELAESQLKEMVDFIEEHQETIKNILEKECKEL